MQEILEESWAYQEMVQKGWLQGHEKGIKEGCQQGLQQGLQQAAINIVVARFAQLESLARARITTIDDLERLQQLIIELSISHSQEETEQLLLSLSGNV